MSHSRRYSVGTLCLHTTNDAAYGSLTEPQVDGVLRLRHAAPYPLQAGLPLPFQVRLCAMRGSRRRWRKVFPKLQGEGNQVPPRIESYT